MAHCVSVHGGKGGLSHCVRHAYKGGGGSENSDFGAYVLNGRPLTQLVHNLDLAELGHPDDESVSKRQTNGQLVFLGFIPGGVTRFQH